MATRRSLLAAALAGIAGRAAAQQARHVQDGVGRMVALPGAVGRVMPAGPPAAVLLWSLAPELMTGWVARPRPAALAFLAPEAATIPISGRLTGRNGGDAAVAAVRTQHPDLVVDYGSVAAPYAALADRIQSESGCPALLLDGALSRIPETYALLGAVLNRQAAAAAREQAARTILAEAQDCAARLQAKKPLVALALGPQGIDAGPGRPVAAEVLDVAGATLLPPGLDHLDEADWVIGDEPGLMAAAFGDRAWKSRAAVQAGRVVVAPGLPFGWLDEPPSVNRLAGLLWLPALFGTQPADRLPDRMAALYALLYGRRPDPAQLAPLLQNALPRR